MEKDQTGNLSSFICYNCNEKNFFDKAKYLNKYPAGMPESTGHGVKEVSIECKSCREINSVKIEY
jgi:hypothetical protein